MPTSLFRTLGRNAAPWLAAACLLTHGPAAAQTPPTAARTLAEVLQAARGSADVLFTARTVEAARADVTAADRAPLPVASARVGSIDLQNGIGTGNLWRDKRLDKSVGLDWTVERGGKRALRTRAAGHGADAAALDLQEVLLQQQVLAAAAFYDLAAAQERELQVAAIGQGAGELAAAGQRRLQAGDISQQESLRVEIEARRAAADLRAAQAERQAAMHALARLTGATGPIQVQPDWPAPDMPDLRAPDADGRPAVRAARLRLQAAQAALDGALALRRNDVTLGASFEHQPGTSVRRLEMRLAMPLAGVLGTYGYEGEIARAGAVLAQAQDQLDRVRLATVTEDARLLEGLRAAAVRQADFQTQIVPRARQVSGMAELAYSRGALALVDLLDARRTLRSVLLDDIAARAEHARLLAAWQLRLAAAAP